VLRKLSLVFLALVLLASCSLSGNETPGATPAPPTSAASPTPGTPLTILILPEDLPQDEYEGYQTLIYDLTQANQMRFQVRNRLSVEEMQLEMPALRIVVALPPDPGLAALAAAAPEVQFLAIGIPDLAEAANLSSIGAGGLPVDQQAFLAGYIAGLLAPEWRVGILTVDTPEGNEAGNAFRNGYRYYCGSCRNPYFIQPRYNYPVVQVMKPDTSEGEYPANAKVLLDYLAAVAYVYPPVATIDVVTYLAQYGAFLVGERLPSEDLRGHWIVSIQPDPVSAIQRIFPELAAGRGGQVLSTPLVLADVNPSLLTEGKQRLVEEVLAGLQGGTIGTGVEP
jgi:hypothetical protein